MSDAAIRALLVGGGTLLVVILALATRRWQRPTHERVDVAGLGLPPGIVIFTSTDCATCKEALARVRTADAPVREVTWELERALLEQAKVAAVPLTVVVADDGTVVDQMVGVPRRRRLARATRRL